MSALGLKHVAVRGVCATILVAIFSVIIVAIMLASCVFLLIITILYGSEGLLTPMLIGLFQGCFCCLRN
jgi:hypothetical protein